MGVEVSAAAARLVGRERELAALRSTNLAC
jgi:hypothetical protein